MSKKVCRKCRLFVDGNECPLCKGTQFTDSWKGKLIITDATKSEIAKTMGITSKGEYAIKIR
ncbi:MAG: transcription elongation factor subunit Spt4 [Candidatus Woesearchaeota archaeon]